MPLYGALEAGGTKMVCAIGDEHGTIRERISIQTEEPQKTMSQMISFFQAKEIQALHSIIEGNPLRKDVYVGTYLLLGDYASAQDHFDGMDSDEQENFMEFPISKFFPKSQAL